MTLPKGTKVAPQHLRAVPAKKPIKKSTSLDANGNPRTRGIIRIPQQTIEVLEDPTRIEDWDDEELRRGRRKDRNGKFTGRDPVVVPVTAYREMCRRAIRSAEVEMASNLKKASEVLVSIMESPAAEDKDRIAAIKMLMDRVMGKEPTQVEHSVKTPLFVGILNGGIVAGGAIAPAPEEDEIIDVESWEE